MKKKHNRRFSPEELQSKEPMISMLGRWKQENQELRVTLTYIKDWRSRRLHIEYIARSFLK